MVEHIASFFATLLGVTLPEIVVVILAFALGYFLLRLFLRVFNVNTRILDFAFYISVVYLALSSLGGFEWKFLFS